MKKKNNSLTSTGNVYADLGFSNPEEMLAKSELARQINNLIKKKKLTQLEAARLLGIDQPKISLLGKGRLFGFSLVRLIKFLNILGRDITIKVTKSRTKTKANDSVSFPAVKKEAVAVKRPFESAHTTPLYARKKNK